MLSCKQVVDHSDQLLAGEVSRRQRLAIYLHLLICVHCRRYLRQLRLLLKALPRLRRRAEESEIEAVMQRLQRSQREAPTAD